MNTEQNRIFLAIVLSGLVLITWQYFYSPKMHPAQVQTISKDVAPTAQPTVANNESVPSQMPTSEANVSNNVEVKTFKIDFGNVSFDISSNGNISNLVQQNTVYDFKDVVGEEFDLKMFANNQLLNFSEANFDNNTNTWQLVDKGLGLTLNIRSYENYFELQFLGSAPQKLAFTMHAIEKHSENKKAREFIFFKDSPKRVAVGKEDSEEVKVKWFGIDFHYHLFSFIGQPELYNVSIKESGDAKFTMLNEAPEHTFKLVFIKKNYDLLSGIGDNVDQSVDFGIFGIVAVPILRVLQYFHKYIPNYGIAIILLTIIIRLLTFPLQFKSFKSMKKMQNIQPEITKLREKFKDDPQRMQKETMELFKRTGANPLGGCLPMLLQMPIFIAFYQVLSNSVELVGAPFYFWLHDLSLKDPFYVLPVVMGIVMFFQSKLNPTPMTDPTQKKMMMFMPIVFTFIMKDLPSGLNLYMTVSIAMGIGQQLLVYRLND